ncbi:MAG: hypothetical protein QFF03_23270 [Pseudomonadota bacterium]|nr:hypothetical protein [Pseudomonadota bacterium]
MKATGCFTTCAALPARRPAAARLPLRRHAGTAPLQADGGGASAPPNPVAIDPPAPCGAMYGMPHVLHIEHDPAAALALSILLTPEARVTHVRSAEAARVALRQQIFSAVVIDPDLPDGGGAELLAALNTLPLVVHSASQPHWQGRAGVFLPKPWTSSRVLWTTISGLLGIPTLTCGD